MARSIILTGSSRGIGRALAAALVRPGDDVTLTARGADELDRVAEQLSALGPGTAEAVQLDVRDREATAALVDAVVQRRGRLDLMINNAGINMAGLVDDLEGSHFDSVMDVNLRGVVNSVLAAYSVALRGPACRRWATASGLGTRRGSPRGPGRLVLGSDPPVDLGRTGGCEAPPKAMNRDADLSLPSRPAKSLCGRMPIRGTGRSGGSEA